MTSSCSVGAPRVLALWCAVMTAGCAIGRAKTVAKVTTGSFCTQNAARALQGRGGPVDYENSAALKAGVPKDQLLTAAAIGGLEAVERYAQLSGQSADGAQRMAARAAIAEAISQASLDVSSTLALLDCEAGRAEVTADALQVAEDSQTEIVTVSGLGLGGVAAALSGILSAVLVSDVPSTVVGVGGGVGEGALSAAALASRHTAPFAHPINPIAELWNGGAHPSLPESVWIHLTTPEQTPEGPRTARDWLMLSWTSTERMGQDAEDDALVLGEGGVYRPALLKQRAVMLTEVRTVVALFLQDLQLLATEVARLEGRGALRLPQP